MKSIKVDFDPNVWTYVPEVWPWKHFTDVEHWATTYGLACAEAAEVSEEQGAELAQRLHSIAVTREAVETRFIYMADPFTTLFYANVLYMDTQKKESLEGLVFAQDPSVVRPVELTQLESPHLGSGVRALRHLADEDGNPAVIAQYAFRANGVDVVVSALSFDVDHLLSVLPAVDALATSISVVRKGFLQRTLTQEA
jgi:hypothetical protein